MCTSGCNDQAGEAREKAFTHLAWVCACVSLLLLANCKSVPPAQPVHITPVTLPPSTATPAQLTSADWIMYHENPALTGYVAGEPDPTRLTSLWKHQLDGAIYAEPP